MIVSTFVLLVFLRDSAEYPSGLLNPGGYGQLGALIGVISVVGAFVSTLTTRGEIYRLPSSPVLDGVRRPWWTAYWDMVQTLRIRSFRFLWCAVTASAIVGGVSSALSLYLAIYFWGMTSEQTFLFVAGYMLALIPSSFLGPWMVRRFDKRPSILTSIFLAATSGVMPILLRILGIAPENGTIELIVFVVTFSVISKIFSVCSVTIGFAMIADVTDEHAL